MQDKLEKLIKVVYRRWKAQHPGLNQSHPDEEALACFLEGRLSKKEEALLQAHLIHCARCAEILAVSLKLEETDEEEVPGLLLEKIKNLVREDDKASVLEVFLKFKEKAIEVLNTGGDILVGRELIPAPLLRSRKFREFKDEVNILKDFKDTRVEIKIENKGTRVFDLSVIAKEKSTQKVIKDIRVTLLRDKIELESYFTDSGRVTFENVVLGRYTVEISTLESRLAAILLEIKI